MLGDDGLAGEWLHLKEIPIPFTSLANRIRDISAIAAAPGLLQPDLGKVVVGTGIVDAANPDAGHLCTSRRLEQSFEMGNHPFDKGEIAAVAVHSPTLGAEIVLDVDQDQGAVPRIDLLVQSVEHGFLLRAHGFQIIDSRSNGLASFCRTAMSRLALRLGTLSSVTFSGRFIAATTSGFAPVYFATKSSRTSLVALIRSLEARSIARLKRRATSVLA